MKYARNILLACCAVFWLCCHTSLCAQQDWGYTQYLFNLYDANAAYAGEHDLMSVSLRYRRQWAGLEGAPVTQVFSLHTPFKNNRWAGGVRLQSENIGGRSQVKARVSGSHRWAIGSGHLNVALSAGAWRQQLLTSELTARDTDDPIMAQARIQRTTPLADLAVMYVHDKWFAGIESGGMTRAPFRWTDGSAARAYRHMTGTAGWMKKIGGKNILQLSMLAKWAENSLYQWETNVSFLFQNKAWIGAGYRNENAYTLYGMLQVTSRFRLGYSFDYMINGLKNYQRGSHEAFVGISLGNNKKRSIRYF